MPIFTDQLNRKIEIEGVPKRIISLVPSQTEFLFDLGLDEEVIGITKFCVHPEHWFRNKARIGGTKTIKIDLIKSLHPDLIIGNKEENTKDQLEELEKIAPLWVSDVQDIAGAFDMMQSIGSIVNKEEKATALIDVIKKDFKELILRLSNKKYRTAYLIWKDPYMAAGGDTFINDMMKLCGWQNVFADTMRYPQTTTTILKENNTELVLLSSEPFPFKQKHIDELQAELPGAKILLVDGEMFSWYGSRMRYAGEYFKGLLTN